MIGFIIISIILLLVLEMVLAWAWYSFLFRESFIVLAGIDTQSVTAKNVRGSFRIQLMLTAIKAVWLTLVVLFLPRGFGSVVVLVLFAAIFPLILYWDNAWIARKDPRLIRLDSYYLVVTHLLCAFVALILKWWLL